MVYTVGIKFIGGVNVEFKIRCKAKDLKERIDEAAMIRRFHIEVRPQSWTIGKPEPKDYEAAFSSYEAAFQVAVSDHVEPALRKGWRVDQDGSRFIQEVPTFQGTPEVKATVERPWSELITWVLEELTTGNLYEVEILEHVERFVHRGLHPIP